MHIWAHLKTVHRHRALVRKYCFRLGLYWQGLTHDLSKYSPTEFWAGAKYYQGDHSPNDAQRKAYGYSAAWMHHKGRNRHHFEFWTDYDPNGSGISGVEMPKKYVAEMFCDRVGASKVYKGNAYTDAAPYEYYMRAKARRKIHPETAAQIEMLLEMLRDKGEKETFCYIKHVFLRQNKDNK